MERLLQLITMSCCILICSFQLHAQNPTLVWSDEFDGTSLDLNKWEPQIGDGCAEGICGWGNDELQYYQAENAEVNNGMLSIIAKKERVKSNAYTSARIRTKNLADFSYGRFEARIKLPAGAGLWPAFWMLSTDEPNGGWPMDGEIDIMEFTSANPDHVYGTIHYGDPYPDNQFQGENFYLYDGSLFTDDFHEYAIEWEPGEIRWYVDDILYSVKTKEDVAPYDWPFDNNRFHFILNTAIGGTLGGEVDDSIFPSTMKVDYVRVYDGNKPSIRGERVVSNQETNVIYNVDKLPSGTNVSWTVPSDASIASGQGTNELAVDFGSTNGDVTATYDVGNGNESIAMNVLVEPSYSKDFSFENFDEAGSATFFSSDGSLTEVQNPDPNTVNGSAVSGEYVRDAETQYDVLFYETSAISNADQYAGIGSDKKFYMDIYTNAPIGTEIILQLETSNATETNYPEGRHSRYVGTITENGNWQRIEFSLLDRPDGGASATIEKMAILFNSNTFTGDTYYFDNLDSYKADTGGEEPVNEGPSVNITNPADGSSFDAGSEISIEASAADSDGSISQVEFFVNGTSIGIDETEPYAVNWSVTEGSQTITATATDNEGAMATSSEISISGTSDSGSATSIYVSEVITGTGNAGGGNKYGTATVTVLDNLDNPVSGTTVSGTFSGTFSESVNGTTGSDGTVSFQTSSTARGGVTVNFCVNNVEGDLTYDPSLNSGSFDCGTSQRTSDVILSNNEAQSEELSIVVYPNPAKDQLWVNANGFNDNSNISIIDINGRVLIETKDITNPIDVSRLDKGLYFLQINDQEHKLRRKFLK
ncbi:MAG: family 16 glycosylhydrolase [Bacteroidota bacterium]